MYCLMFVDQIVTNLRISITEVKEKHSIRWSVGETFHSRIEESRAFSFT